ncbi:hypothetical protein L5515_002081 [Caenorhabditis briggsae]|nr:hypothetical protein L5515_002081 [Caenorhabditis briggsae]
MGAAEGQPIINIRIFGKSLKQLAKDGISLESLLISIGLTNVEITEEIPYQPTLSTTVCNEDVPRCSTPNNRQLDLRRKITFNLPERISEITPNSDDNFSIDNQWKLDVDEVINRLLEVVEENIHRIPLVQNVFGRFSVESFPVYPTFDFPHPRINDQPTLSTTVCNLEVPRCSTPNNQQLDIQRKFTLNLLERISEITPNTDDNFSVDNQWKLDVDEVINRLLEVVGENVQTVSAQFESSPVYPSIDFSHTSRQPTLSTTVCHVPRCSTPKLCSPKLEIQRKFTLNLPERISEIPHETEGNQLRFEVAEDVECIRAGVENPADPSFDQYHTSSIEDTVDLSEEYPKEQYFLKTTSDSDYVDWKDCDKNGVFVFNCNFPNCNHQIKWKRKARLQFLSHALVHNTKEVFKCIKCKRQKLMMSSYDKLRSHYVSKHPTVKVPRIGLYEHFAGDEFLKNLVNECFGKEIDVINKRIKRKVLERKQVPVVASFISEEF